jgi:hypothetical protein
MKSVGLLTAIAGACCLAIAAHAQGIDIQKSGNDKLFTLEIQGANGSITGVGPVLDFAKGKVFEVNVSAVCPGSGSMSVTVVSLNNDGFNTTVQAQGPTLTTGPLIGFQRTNGNPAISVDCDVVNFIGPLQVLAVGHVLSEEGKH